MLLQAPLFAAAATAEGWTLFALQIAFMIAVFGAIPFTDALIVRFVDDRMRSRVSGMRLAVSLRRELGRGVDAGTGRQGRRLQRAAAAMAGISLVTLLADLAAAGRRARPRGGGGRQRAGSAPRSSRAAD